MTTVNPENRDLVELYRELMKKEGQDDLIIETFLYYFRQVREGITGKLTAQEIKPPEKTNLIELSDLEQKRSENLHKMVVIKLNGGLGTSMGLKKSKSLLPVKGEHNFLDIIAQQILHLRKSSGAKIPLLLMNSFNTNEDTLRYLEKYPELGLFEVPLSFTQNKYPRINRETLLPYNHPNDLTQNWNPPGHGDIYTAMAISGVLDRLLNSGIEYAFISNSDNLGAVVDERILDYVFENNIPFLMEVCHRSEIDKKGGHLAQSKDGELVLREIAQCPEKELDEFQNIKLYSFFNTNNLWVNLKELKKAMEKNDNLFLLPIIVNPKVVAGTPVIQIETAMGAAISRFSGSKALIVPRERFVPVKKTNDLLTIWSDAYTLRDDFKLELNEECDQIPTVILDEEYYGTIEQMQKRMETAIPSLKKCRRLEITGDIHFGENVTIRGKVKLEAKQPVFIYDEIIKEDLTF
jgi:UTP--glucose-1-phosphate uridylyltransferase